MTSGIFVSRKICHNLGIKDSRTCDVCELIKKIDVLPELVVDLQASSARGAAQMSLSMCLAHAPTLDIDKVTMGISKDANANKLLDACAGYNTRIARRIRHDKFYDDVVLLADEALEAELEKKRQAEARPTESKGGSWFTWTSSKDEEKSRAKGGDGEPSSLAKDAEGTYSPTKGSE
jgi:hypothetical protein